MSVNKNEFLNDEDMVFTMSSAYAVEDEIKLILKSTDTTSIVTDPIINGNDVTFKMPSIKTGSY